MAVVGIIIIVVLVFLMEGGEKTEAVLHVVVTYTGKLFLTEEYKYDFTNRRADNKSRSVSY